MCFERQETTSIRSVDFAYLEGLIKAGSVVQADAAASRQVHFTPDGSVLVSTSAVSGLDGSVTLRGALGTVPFDVTVKVKLQDSVIEVTLDMAKPVDLSPYTWRFNLQGLVRGADGPMGATSITPSPQAEAAEAKYWCILKCAGPIIGRCLAKCLPSLVGGPKAYLGCVVGCLGTSAAEIAECVVKCL